MKPLKIKISAFGPYKNCIDIDFEKLGESGIFLITGDTGAGKTTIFDSISFAIALGYALVTMYDAAGVRRAAGKTAACLNKMMDDFYKHDVQAIGGKLKELLGHTPFEVIMGAIYGVAFTICFHKLLVG